MVIIDGEKIAYIQEGSQEARPRKVKENESFSGCVVKAIRPDGMTFLFSGSEINVPLRMPKDAAGEPPPAARVSPAPPRAPETPTAFPRRQLPTGIQPGQMPTGFSRVRSGAQPDACSGTSGDHDAGDADGRTRGADAGTPDRSGVEVFGDEEFPEGSVPGGEMPEVPEDGGGE